MTYIIAIGLFQAVLAAALLWRSGFARKGDTILAALMVCIAAHMAIKLSIYTLVSDGAVRSQMNTCIGFCYGPLLVLYGDQLTLDGSAAIRRWFLFVPFTIALVGYLTVISVLAISADIGHLVLSRYNATTWFLIPVLNTACAVRSFRRPSVRSDRSVPPLLLRLGILLILASAVPVGLSLFHAAVPSLPGMPMRNFAYLIIAAMPLTIVWDLASIKRIAGAQPAATEIGVQAAIPAATNDPSHRLESGTVESVTVKPLTIIDPEHGAALLAKVDAFLSDPDNISDPGLNLERLANGVGASRHQVSEMLNGFAGQSFYEFLSARRIQRTMSQMAELRTRDIPVNILILAFDNGFKAKSSFNAAFRKCSGMTPTEYLSQLRQQEGRTHPV